MLWLDKYERYARVAPGLFAVLPVVITVTALGYRQVPVVSVAVSLLSLAGGPVLLADTVRQFGQRAQDKLWSEWGGAPTVLALRLRESSSNTVQRDIWRSAIEKISGVKLISRTVETKSPHKADEAIEAAVARLRELTRGENKFPLVQAENRSYGFQRNFYGIRWLGRLVAFLGMLVIAGFMTWNLLHNQHSNVPTADVLGLLLNGAIMLAWFALPSPRRVRVAGDKYAHQLLHAAVSLAAGNPISTAGDSAATGTDGQTSLTGTGFRRAAHLHKMYHLARSCLRDDVDMVWAHR